MCGIAGRWRPGTDDPARLMQRAAAMGLALAHRGPDGMGRWTDADAGLALVHRRLAVLDLSPTGQQPMASACGRWVLAFNGELYDHEALRAQLSARGHRFRGRSDTEVLLAAIVEWGVPGALERGNAMLALAAWDRRERVLWLARDRLGEKPLYYARASDGALLFGSELAALRADPALAVQVDPDALALLLRLGYIPAPHSILRGVHKLPAGHLLRVDATALAAGLPASVAWYDARARQAAAIERGFDGDAEEALDALEPRLREAVRLRLQADVPTGVFLSGGTDSSLVAALAQAQSSHPVRTFSMGFDFGKHDESAHAAAVAAHLGTEHTRLHVDGRAALDLVPALPRLFDEPFADSSQIPTALLCRAARQHVTVALGGDGGDELFFGYRRYARALRREAWLSKLPRRALAALAGEAGENARLGGLAALRAELGATDLQAVARLRASRWQRPEAVVTGARRLATAYDDPRALPGAGTPGDALMAMDIASYLPEDILAKVDRASMAVGLEARSPLLDWRLAEFAWSLPMAMKYRGGQTKWLLRKVLSRHLPAPLVQRPKVGFGAPVGDWLRGPLRDWAEALLDERGLREQGHFAPAPVRAVWTEFLAGRRKWHSHLWGVLMFQAWREALRAPAGLQPPQPFDSGASYIRYPASAMPRAS